VRRAGRQRYGRFADPDTGGYRMGDDSWDESDRDDPENADDKVKFTGLTQIRKLTQQFDWKSL
jgi:hypothetical protein